MSQIRIIFFGTPYFAQAHLKHLLQDEHYVVVGVVTQPDRPSGRRMQMQPSPVKQLALDSKIPCFTPSKVTDDFIEKELKPLKAEAAVVVAYGQILSQAVLDLYPQKIVNVHGSLLPRWRGAAPIQRAIMAGDLETGVSLQVMVKKLDAGPILGAYKIPITPHMTAVELHDQMIPLGQKLLHIDFIDYLHGHIFARPQDESLVTYAEKIDKKESLICWNEPAQKIHNQVRGLTLGPGTFTWRQGKKLKIVSSSVTNSSASSVQKPGSIVLTPEGFDVCCGEGWLTVKEVQPESKPKMAASDYLRGYPVQAGEFFEF